LSVVLRFFRIKAYNQTLYLKLHCWSLTSRQSSTTCFSPIRRLLKPFVHPVKPDKETSGFRVPDSFNFNFFIVGISHV